MHAATGTRCPPPLSSAETKNFMSKSEEIHWYPMRVTYSREMAAKQFLDLIGVDCFIPMKYVPIKGKHPRHRELKPAITSLIFIRASQQDITFLKMTRRELSSIRYIMKPVLDDDNNVIRKDIMTVPDKEMDNFIRVASINDDRVFYMENLNFAGKPGQRVRVVEGDFAGVEGTIKRIKKNKHVVVQIENVAAVAIAFLPAAFLLPLDAEKKEEKEEEAEATEATEEVEEKK